MNDQELARQIVAHLGGDGPNNYAAYSIVIDGIAHWMPVEKFVRDWRVAGAMMEKVHKNANRRIVTATGYSDDSAFSVQVSAYFGSTDLPRYGATNESLPRAINEACVEAHRS